MTAAQQIANLIAALERTQETLGQAATRGTRAKPTVAELNSILDDVGSTLRRVKKARAA